MWTRAELKTRAKKVLATSYWMDVVAYLVFIGITMVAASLVARLAPALSLGVSLFLSLPLMVGIYYFFLKNRSGGAPEIKQVFFAFGEQKYLSIVGAMAWMTLFIFLWALIPIAGIVMVVIKGISYSMTPMLLTDNPRIGYDRALKLSIAMTEGHKGDIFVLGLSFIGWALLATLALGIGWLFLYPYITATFAELYVTLRQDAISKGLCTKEELNLGMLPPQ